MAKALTIFTAFVALMIAVPAHAQDGAEKAYEPHPAMAGFIAELKSGQLDEAAARLTKVGDFEWMGVPPLAHDFSRHEFVEFLSKCELSSEDYKSWVGMRIQKAEWNCPDGQRYLVNFLPEDEMKINPGMKGPYLQVILFETPEMETARIEAMKARRAALRKELSDKWGGNIPPPPPISIRELSEEEQQARGKQRQLAHHHRDQIGKAVAKGDLEVFSQFATSETNFRYIAHDPYFDVSFEHKRGSGEEALKATFLKAIDELGKPVSSDCYRTQETYPTHLCRWELSNSENGLFAEMSFKGEGGTLSFVRIYRELPSERQAMRERAIKAGIING